MAPLLRSAISGVIDSRSPSVQSDSTRAPARCHVLWLVSLGSRSPIWAPGLQTATSRGPMSAMVGSSGHWQCARHTQAHHCERVAGKNGSRQAAHERYSPRGVETGDDNRCCRTLANTSPWTGPHDYLLAHYPNTSVFHSRLQHFSLRLQTFRGLYLPLSSPATTASIFSLSTSASAVSVEYSRMLPSRCA